jgi:hypothetical protein
LKYLVLKQKTAMKRTALIKQSAVAAAAAIAVFFSISWSDEIPKYHREGGPMALIVRCANKPPPWIGGARAAASVPMLLQANLSCTR